MKAKDENHLKELEEIRKESLQLPGTKAVNWVSLCETI